MISTLISVATISVAARKRPVDSAVVAELKKSIEQQGLLQNIGVRVVSSGHQLVFGAHRLEAVRALDWTEISALVFPADASDEECLLAELQENNARKELTGAERKAFAAEIGRLIIILFENSTGNDNSHREFDWFVEWRDKARIPTPTAYKWWNAFCVEIGLKCTPAKATKKEREAFFSWLDAQKAKEDEANAVKVAEAEAEKQRKEQEAKDKRMQKDKQELFDYVDATALDWGKESVIEWISEWLKKTES